jgi:hypothetical protein
LQLVASWQMKLLGQGTAALVTQAPWPLQTCPVIMSPEQESVPHAALPDG